MKKILSGILLNLFLGFLLNGQELNKRHLHGTWVGDATGAPGRTIKQKDSTYIKLLPSIYSITTIELKRFGRAVIQTKGCTGMGIDSELKGKWKLKGDTLSLRFKHLEEMYLIDQSIEDRIFFKSFTSGRFVYGRKE